MENIFWFANLTSIITHAYPQIQFLDSSGVFTLVLLFTQEYSSAIGGYVGLAAGVTTVLAAVQYVRGNPKYLSRLRIALLAEAVFFLLLAPSSIHHLVGYALGLGGNFYVGISYLLQVTLIVPPLLILSHKIKNPQNTEAIIKWGAIATVLITFGLWCKYLLLWVDTLVPLGPKEASVASMVGAANSLVTLLVAGIVMAVGCFGISQKKRWSKKAAALGLVLVGSFFIIYTFVAFFVPVYASFWYLTDTWMLTLPLLGAAYLFASRKP